MNKGKLSSAKHAKNQNAAVAYLRRMPIWQRVVSAIMAVLLAFLLWPADAAKTFRAWADAAAEAAAEQQAAITEDDSGGTEAEADVGGEEATEETDEAENPAATDEESSIPHEDGEIFTEDGSPVPNANPEACGPYVWDFSAYSSKVTISRVTTSSTPATLEYADKDKKAQIKFYGPVNYTNGRNTDYNLDGGDASLKNGDGWKMNATHKLFSDSGKSDTNGIVNKSNFIEFIPSENFQKIIINCASISYSSSGNRCAIIGIVKANGTADVWSNNTLKEFTLNSTSSKDVTFDASQIPGLDNYFEAGQKYYIYSRPNTTSKSSYNSYGGLQIKKITAQKAESSIAGEDLVAPVDDKITFTAECSAKSYTRTKTPTVYAGQAITDIEFTDLTEGDAVTITASSLLTGRSVQYNFDSLSPGENSFNMEQLKLPELYLALKGTFTNAGSQSGNFKLIYGDAEHDLGTVAGGAQTEFTFSGLWGAGFLKVVNTDPEISDYDEIYIPENTSTEITGITLTINPSEQNSLWLKNTPWQEGYTGEYVDDLIHQRVYYMCPIFGQEGQYQRRYIDPIVYYESSTDKWPVAEYPAKVGEDLHVLADPNGIYSVDGENNKIAIEGYTLTTSKAHGKTVVPTYEWAADNEGNFVLNNYKCTAKYTDWEGRYHEQTIYTDEAKWNDVGKITRVVTKRPTDTAEGEEELTATWTLDDEYFYPPQVKKYTIPEDKAAHTHTLKVLDNQQVTFEKWEGQDFPTTSGKNYYLTKDVTISAQKTISGNVKVDLNGYAVKITYTGGPAIKVNNGGTLTLYDCCMGQQGCRHYFTGNYRETWKLTDDTSAAHYVDGGVITGASRSAILNEGTLNCEQTQFVGNGNTYNSNSFGEGSGGGAIRSGRTNGGSTLKIESCDFLGNTSQGAGGAVLVGVSNEYTGTAKHDTKAYINNTHFSDNALLGESSATSGYVIPWGGGALATFNAQNNYTTGKGCNPYIEIRGCNFENNASNYRGGAILLFHGTECHMSDTTITNNRSGIRHETVSSTSVCYNYGGGVNVYTGYGSTNKNQAFLYLSGHVVIRHNNSREYKSGKETWHEDNLALQLQDSTKGYVRFDKNPATGTYPSLDSSSFVGINYAKNYNVDCTKGYAEGILPGEDLSDPSVKNFYLDDVVNRYKYALLIQIGQGTKGKNATYELWIVDHTHKFNYVTSSTRNNTVYDRLTISCATESGQRAHTINGVNYYFSKCMYALDPLELTIHSRDGGDDGVNTIPYEPGVSHPCIIDNSDEFEEYAGGQYAGEMQYFKKVDNGHGSIIWEQIREAPIEPGVYKAQQSFYETKVENDQIVTDYTKQHTIVSNEYEIAGSNLQIEIVTTAEKDYDGSSAVPITGARLKGRIGAEEEVELSTTEGFNAYSESPYVCKNDETTGDPIPWKLVSFDTDKVKLVGADAWKYHISGISGTVVIKPVDQNITYEPLQLWPKPSEEQEAVPYDLVDKLRGLQGNPEVIFEPEVGTEEYKPFTEYASLTPADAKHIIQVTALAEVIGKLKSEGGEAEELDSGLLGFYKKAFVKHIDAADINGDGVPEYNEYDRPTEISDEDPHVPLTFLSGLYDQTEIHFKVGYLNKSGEFIEEPDAGSVLLGNNSINSAKIVKSSTEGENYPRIYHEGGNNFINFFDVAQQTRNFKIVSKDATRWEPASIITPDDETWNLSDTERSEYNWKGAESIDYNYDFKIVFKKLTFPDMKITVSSNQDPQVPLEYNTPVEYTITLENTGNMDFSQTNIITSLCGNIEVGDLPAETTITKTCTHNVTEEDIIAGSFTNNFYAQASYPDEEGVAQTYTTNDVALTHITVTPRYVNPTMTLRAEPDTSDPVYYGTKITYWADITNNSNVSLTGAVLSDPLVGAVNDNIIKVNLAGGQKIAPYQTVTVQINGEGTALPQYEVDNVPVDGNILNEAEFISYIKIGGVDKMYSCTADIEHHMDYTEIDAPVPIAEDLIYNGKEQFGVDFDPQDEGDNASKIDILSSEVGRDVGTYTVICKPKPWYKWAGKSGAEALATIEVTYEIKPAPLTVYYQAEEDEYTGQPLSFEWTEEGPDRKLEDIITGFVNPGGSYQVEGATSVTLTTNGSNVLYDTAGEPDSYKGIGPGLTQNKLVINTKDNTKLSNYTIVYEQKEATDPNNFEITISPRNLNDETWIEALSGKDYTYDGSPHSAVASVKLVNPDETIAPIQLIKDVDWEFDEGAEGSVVTATNASLPKGQTEDPGYNAVIKAKVSSNFTGSTSVNWKIFRKALTFNVPADNSTVTYDKASHSITGFISDQITCNDPSFPDAAWSKENIKTTKNPLSVSGTNVGTYKLFEQEGVQDSFYYDDNDGNVDNIDESFTFSGGILTINPMSIEGATFIVDPTSYTYDANEHTAQVTITPSAGGDPLTTADFVITGQTTGTNAGSYSIVITGTGNYTGSRPAAWKIIPLDIYLQTGATAEKVYDDKLLTTTVDQTITGDATIKYTLTSSGFDAGVYGGTDTSKTVIVTYALTDGIASNYTIHNEVDPEADPPAVAPVLTINQRPINIKTYKENEFVYDAKTHTIDSNYMELATPVPNTGLLAQHRITNILWDGTTSLDHIGTVSANAIEFEILSLSNEDVGSNYTVVQPTSGTGILTSAKLSITKRNMKIEVVGNSSTVTYDGQDHNVSGYTVKEIANEDGEITGLFDPTKLSPSSDLVSTGDQKYFNSTAEDNTYKLLYNGEALDQSDFSYDNGNIEAQIVFDDQGGLKINKKDLRFNVFDTAPENEEGLKLSYIIDTKDSVQPGELTGLVEGDNLRAIFTTKDYITGTYIYPDGVEVNVSFDSEDYADSYNCIYSAKLVISSNIVITIKTKSDTQVFNGEKHEMSNWWNEAGTTLETRTDLDITATGTDFDIKKLHCTAPSKLSISGSNVGTYQYPLSVNDFYYEAGEVADEDEPVISVVLGQLEITPFDLQNAVIKDWLGSQTYNTGALEPTLHPISSSIVIPETDYAIWLSDVNAEHYSEINAGDYTLKLTPKNGNFTGSLSREWSITKAERKLSIKGNQNVTTYNGYEQMIFGYDATDITPSSNRTAWVFDPNMIKPSPADCVASGTDAGTYLMGLEDIDWSYEDNNYNVTFAVADGVLLIKKAVLTDLIEITPGETEFTFDGTEKTTTPTATWKSTGKPFDINNFNIQDNVKTEANDSYFCKIEWTHLLNFDDGDYQYQWVINSLVVNVDIVGKTKTVDYNGSTQPDTPYKDFDVIVTEHSNLVDPNNFIYQGDGVQATNAGTYWVNLEPLKFSYQLPTGENKRTSDVVFNFSIKQDACLIIKPIDISNAAFTVDNRDLTYNFAEQGPTYSGQYQGSPLVEGKDFHVAGEKAVNVGNYDLVISGVEGGNFTGSLTYPWVIKKLAIGAKITAKNDVTAEYDGTEHFIKGYENIEETTITGHLNDINVLPAKNDIVVSGTNVGVYNMNILRTAFTCDNDNIDFSYTISKAATTPDTNEDTTLTITDTSWDTYEASATNLIYNGREQTTSITVTNGLIVLKEGVDFEVVDGNKGTNVGEYTAEIKPIGNFRGNNKNVPWKINKANLNIQIVGTSQTIIYDAEDHAVEGYTYKSDNSLFDPEKVSVDETYIPKIENKKDAGIYSQAINLEGEVGQAVNLTYEDVDNFNINVTATDLSLIINKKEATLTKTASKVYDITGPLTATFDENDFKGLAGEDKLTGTLRTNSIVPATYDVYDDTSISGFSVIWDDAPKSLVANYDITYKVSLTILSTDNIILVKGNTANYTYDGTQHEVEGFTFEAPSGFEGDVKTVDGSVPKAIGRDAGTYYMNYSAEDFTYTGGGNYVIQYVDGYLNIEKKNIQECDITVEPREFVYTGQEQGPIVTVKDGGKVVSSSNYILTNGTKVDAGTYNLMIGGLKNYTGIISNDYLWTIRKADASVYINADIEYANDFVTYELSNGDVTGVLGNDELYGRFTTRGKEIGTYIYDPNDATANGLDLYELNEATNNYNLSYNVRINIVKHVLNINPGYKRVPYNGLPQYILESEVNYYGSGGEDSVGILPGHAVTIVEFNNRTQTNVGNNEKVQVDSVIIRDAVGNIVSEKYQVNFLYGTIEVFKAQMKLQITGNRGSFAYDGKAHTVKGYDAYEVPVAEGGQITGLFKPEKLTTTEQFIATQTAPGKAWMFDRETIDPYYYFKYNDNNIDCSYDYTNGYAEVVAADWDNVVISTTNVTYNGREQNANLKVTNGNQYLVEGTDYEIVEEESVLTATGADVYDIKIISLGKYGEGKEKTGTWEIYKANMEIGITGNSAVYYYDTKEKSVGGANYNELTKTGLLSKSAIEYKVGVEEWQPVSDTNPMFTIDAAHAVPGTYNKGLDSKDFKYTNDNINAKFTIVKDMQIDIKKPNIGEPDFTVETNSPLRYNGSAQTPTLTVKQAIEGEEEQITLVLGKDYEIAELTPQTNVGTYYAAIKGIGNYTGVKQTITWQIIPKDITITVTGSSNAVVYDGQYHEYGVANNALTFASSDPLFNVLAVNVDQSVCVSGVDAGTYSMDVSANKFTYRDTNINATFDMGEGVSISLTIDKRPLHITAVETKKHDSTELTHNILQTEVSGAVAGQVVTGTAVSYKEEEGQAPQPCSDVGVYPDPEENHIVMFNIAVDGKVVDIEPEATNAEGANYYLENSSQLQIVEAGGEYFIDVYGTTVTKEYNGQDQSIDLTGGLILNYLSFSSNIPNFNASNVAVSGFETPSGKVVGTYSWQGEGDIGIVYQGYEGATVDIKDNIQLTITKRDINKANARLSQPRFEYNRQEQKPEETDLQITDLEPSIITENEYSIEYGTKGTKLPGTYNFNIVAKEDGNYYGTKTLSYTISPAQRFVKIIGNHDELAYNGSEQSVNGYWFVEYYTSGDLSPVNPEDMLFDLNSFDAGDNEFVAKGTNIGTYYMGIDVSKFSYNGTKGDDEYDDINYINVGFQLGSDGFLTITQGELRIVFTEPAGESPTFTYDGTLKTPQYDVYFGETKLSEGDYTISGTTTATDAEPDRGYTFTATGAGKYAGMQSEPATWYIAKAKRQIKITGHQSTKTYNAQEQSVTGFDFEEIIPVGESAKLIKSELINSGESPVSRSGKNVKRTDSGEVDKYPMNINISEFSYNDLNVVIVKAEGESGWELAEDGWLQINPCALQDVVRTLTPRSYVYDKENHIPSLTLQNGTETLDLGTDYTVDDRFVEQKEIGAYPFSISIPASGGSGNYILRDGKVIDETWSIVPAVMDIYITGNNSETSNPQGIPYDGSEHTVDGFTATCDSPLWNPTEDPDKIVWTDPVTEEPGTPNVTSKEVGIKYMGLNVLNFSFNQTVTPSGVPIDVKFHIVKDGWIRISNKAITFEDLDPIKDQSYIFTNGDIEAHFDLVRDVNGTKIPLVEGIDYDIYDNVAKYVNDESTGEWYTTSKIVFKGNYSGTLVNTADAPEDDRLYFQITKAELVMIATGVQESVPYDGKEHIAAGYTLKEKEDGEEGYEATGFDFLIDQNLIRPTKGDAFVVGTNKGTYTKDLDDFTWTYPEDRNLDVIIQVDHSTDVSDKVILNIEGKPLNDPTITVECDDLVYNGLSQFPEVHVIDSTAGELGEWDVIITPNPQVNVQVDPTTQEIIAYPFTIKGFVDEEGNTGNYSGERTEYFKIVPKEVTYKFEESKVYDGKVIEYNETIGKDEFPELCEEDQYVIKAITKKADAASPNASVYPYSPNQINGAWLSLTAEAASGTLDTNYIFNISNESIATITPYEIKANDTRVIFEMVSEIVYDGKIHYPQYKLYDKAIETSPGVYYDLRATVDFNSNPGPKKHVNNEAEGEKYTVDFEAKGNYTGAWGSEWKITPRPASGFILDETDDPKAPDFRGNNKEYDGTPCSINLRLGNGVGKCVLVTDMLDGDYVNFNWTTNSADVKYDENGNVIPYVWNSDPEKTEIIVNATDAINSNCYARDYAFSFEASISIYPRTIDPSEDFVFGYEKPIYNGQNQIIYPNKGVSTEPGAAWLYDKVVGAYLSLNDFDIVGNMQRNVPIGGGEPYSATINGKGNYRNLRADCMWTIAPYKFTHEYYDDTFSECDEQYKVDEELMNQGELLFVDDEMTLKWLTWEGSSEAEIPGTKAGTYSCPYIGTITDAGELTYTIIADNQTKANYEGSIITGTVVIQKREILPENVHFTIADLTYSGGNQAPTGTNDIKAVDENYHPARQIEYGQFNSYFEFSTTPEQHKDVNDKSSPYTLDIKGLDGTDYEGITWTAVPWNITQATVEFTYQQANFTFNGSTNVGQSVLTSSSGVGIKGTDQITVDWTSSSPNVGEYKYNWTSENDGSISFIETASEGTSLNNYHRIYHAMVVIEPKNINDDTVEVDDELDPDTDYPEYTGGVVYPTFHIVDNEVGTDELVYGRDYTIDPGGVDVKTDGETYTSKAKAVEGGNYTGLNDTEVEWNVRPKQVDIVVDDSKVYDGEVFASRFKLETGTTRVAEGNTPEEVYINSETDSEEIGDYIYEPEANDGQVIFDPETGIEWPFAWGGLYNFKFDVNDPQITLHITESPVPPEPTPPEPEYVDAQTGDMAQWIIYGLLASALVCAFITIRRRKHSADKRWNA